jgi:hypothetical protein
MVHGEAEYLFQAAAVDILHVDFLVCGRVVAEGDFLTIGRERETACRPRIKDAALDDGVGAAADISYLLGQCQ